MLFDGYCNFCSGLVNWIIKHDPNDHFRFAPLQSDAAENISAGIINDLYSATSLILIEKGKVYKKSTAALRICRKLNGILPALYVLIIIPRSLRDVVYSFIAKQRMKFFGKSEVCYRPNPEWKDKFL